MKVGLTVSIILFLVSNLVAQNVGINIVTPIHTLDVRSLNISDPAGLNISNQNRSRFVRFFSGSDMFPDPSMAWAPDFDFLFATYNDTTFAFNEYMRITSTGNVGIGVTNPLAKLEIASGNYDLDIGGPGDLKIGNGIDSFRVGVDQGVSGKGITRMYTSGDTLILGTVNQPRLTIAQNGTIGIGNITNPKSQLHLDGSIRITNTILRGYPTSFIIQDQGQNRKIGLYENFSEWSPNFTNTIKLGSSGRRYSEIWSVNALNTSSDRRLKKEIKSIDYGLATVLKLKPVSYRWKQGNQDTKLGFIAQDVVNVVPEIVKLEITSPERRASMIESGRQVPEEDYYAMSYTELIPVLVKALQEQNEIIEKLKEEVKKSDKIYSALLSRIEKLEVNSSN